eukprot:274428-Chlamydomonas_euryale.AAC.7
MAAWMPLPPRRKPGVRGREGRRPRRTEAASARAPTRARPPASSQRPASGDRIDPSRPHGQLSVGRPRQPSRLHRRELAQDACPRCRCTGSHADESRAARRCAVRGPCRVAAAASWVIWP